MSHRLEVLIAFLVGCLIGTCLAAPFVYASSDKGNCMVVSVFGLDHPQPNSIQKVGATVAYVDQNNRLCAWYRGGPYLVAAAGAFDPRSVQPASEGVIFFNDKSGAAVAWVCTSAR